jgi:hypothetical protein
MIAIHVIDGDAATRLAARRVLERAGFAVTEGAGADASVRPSPALVIADPAIAGPAAIRRLHPGAKILAISSGKAAIGKPFTPSQLLTAVRLSLARRAATTAR